MALECAVVNWKKAYTLQRFFRNAVCQNDVTTVRGLIMNQRDEIDLDAWNSDGICPIHQCCIDGNKKLMSILLKAGANINAADPKGWTSLHTSAAIGNHDLTKYLLKKGADITAETTNNELPIDLSFNVSIALLLGNAMKSQGYVEEAEFYISKIKEYQKTQTLRTHTRQMSDQRQYLEEDEFVCDATSRRDSNRSQTSFRKDSLTVRQPSRRNSKSKSSVPSTRKSITDVSLNLYPTSILKKCDSMDSSSSSSSGENSPSTEYPRSTPSTGHCSPSYSRTCSSSSSDEECFENDGIKYPILKTQHTVQFDSEALFMDYVQENEYTKLSHLLETLTDLSIINTLDRKGLSAVHWAAIKGYPDCISVLERFGAKVDIIDPFGWTPLHAAVVTNNTKCVSKLLELSADVYALTNDGEGVFDWPVEEDVLKLLRNHIRDNIDGSDIRCTNL